MPGGSLGLGRPGALGSPLGAIESSSRVALLCPQNLAKPPLLLPVPRGSTGTRASELFSFEEGRLTEAEGQGREGQGHEGQRQTVPPAIPGAFVWTVPQVQRSPPPSSGFKARLGRSLPRFLGALHWHTLHQEVCVRVRACVCVRVRACVRVCGGQDKDSRPCLVRTSGRGVPVGTRWRKRRALSERVPESGMSAGTGHGDHAEAQDPVPCGSPGPSDVCPPAGRAQC